MSGPLQRGVKALGVAVLLLTSASLTAQDEAPASNTEIKVNGFYVLLGVPEVSYERLVDDETAFGVSLAIAVDPDIELRAGITPFYRWYFSKKPSEGVFIESVASVYVRDGFFEGGSSQDIAGGIGFSLGYKLVSTGGWVGEFYAGAGRNFINNDIAGNAFPRLGFCIGRRLGY